MEQKVNSLESFLWVADTQHPEIKDYIVSKSERTVELHLPYDHEKTWEQISTSIDPFFLFPCSFPIKRVSVSLGDKSDFYRVVVDLI